MKLSFSYSKSKKQGGFTMAKAIEIIEGQTDVSEFENVKPRYYEKISTSRFIKSEEKWLVVYGSAEITDGLTGKVSRAKKGDIIKLPLTRAIQLLNVRDIFGVKQIIMDEQTRNKYKANMMINYTILDIILKSLGKYKILTGISLNAKPLFEGGKIGDIFAYYEKYNDVAMWTKFLAEESEISEDIWLGKCRLKTGLRYKPKDGFSKEDLELIDNKNLEIVGDKALFKQLLKDSSDCFSRIDDKEGMYDLKNLILILIRSMKIQGELSRNIRIKERKSWDNLDEKGLPPNIIYGPGLKKAIAKLSVAFEYIKEI